MICCKCIQPSWSGGRVPVPTTWSWGAVSCLAILLLAACCSFSLVTGLPRIMPFREGLGLHDICPLGSSQDRTRLWQCRIFPVTLALPTIWLSHGTGKRMQQGGRVCCV